LRLDVVVSVMTLSFVVWSSLRSALRAARWWLEGDDCTQVPPFSHSSLVETQPEIPSAATSKIIPR